MIDSVGADALHLIKDGSRVRLLDGVVHLGEREVARGVEQTPDSVADSLVEAKSGLTLQLEAFAANTIEFMRRERGLLLDGAEAVLEATGARMLHVAAARAGESCGRRSPSSWNASVSGTSCTALVFHCPAFSERGLRGEVAAFAPREQYAFNTRWPPDQDFHMLREVVAQKVYRELWAMDFDTFVLTAYVQPPATHAL